MHFIKFTVNRISNRNTLITINISNIFKLLLTTSLQTIKKNTEPTKIPQMHILNTFHIFYLTSQPVLYLRILKNKYNY